MPKISVLVVDDHPLMRRGISQLLALQEGIEIVGTASSSEEAVNMCRQYQPDIVILDLKMPGSEPLELLRKIRLGAAHSEILIYSAYVDESLVRLALSHNVAGYMEKGAEPDELLFALMQIKRGGGYFSQDVIELLRSDSGPKPGSTDREGAILTEKEADVLRNLAAGKTVQQIAEETHVTERTVRYHLTNIFRKIEVSTQGQAIAWAYQSDFMERNG